MAGAVLTLQPGVAVHVATATSVREQHIGFPVPKRCVLGADPHSQGPRSASGLTWRVGRC